MTISAVKTPDAKHGPEDSLKSLPMEALFKKLDSTKERLDSSGGREAVNPIRPERAHRKEEQSISEVPRLLLGTDSMDD